jgi:hypothetical protein
MTNLQFIITVIGSGAFSPLFIFCLTWIKDHLIEKNKIAKERERELYSQLKLYLKLIHICKTTRAELWENRKKRFEERTQDIKDAKQKGELLMDSLYDPKVKEFTSSLINNTWIYIESIKKLFEEKTKYIKTEDWPIAERFFKAYFVREIVTGKQTYKDMSHVFTDEKYLEAFDGIFTVISELTEKLKVN